jgi:hypothetical protein
MFQSSEPVPYKPISECPAKWIDTKKDLEEMCKVLESVDIIAVDLEVVVNLT